MRMCVTCRKRFYKEYLTRFVFAEGKVPVEDRKKNMPGRGVYVCSEACRQKMLHRLHTDNKGVFRA
jgi:predicted RNA-binding protein YlxR (DUF448 family)